MEKGGKVKDPAPKHRGQGTRKTFSFARLGHPPLHLGYEVATLNLRDFQRIPGLSVIQL